MLTFLRNMRKSIIGSGHTRKYLLYALGEIALVVIGILIALQINTWNQKRIERINEMNLLNLLQENLQDQRRQAQFSRNLNNDRLVWAIDILEYLNGTF